MHLLTIETTCDETAAAIITNQLEVKASVVASQDDLHRKFGGVVPEIASRAHLERILPVIHATLQQANLTLADIDAVAVANTPGLAGSLLVGLVAAKALCVAIEKPLLAVNHLQAHIYACRLAAAPQEVFPCVGLIISGGHTSLYRCLGPLDFEMLGATIDDAAGEAFDKVAKLLGLGYPGGPWIDALAKFGNPQAVPFAFAQIKTKVHLAGRPARTKAARTAPIARLDPRFLFSFSGIKTAVLRYVELHGLRAEAKARVDRVLANFRPPQTREEALALCPQTTLDLIASFQHAIIGDLMKKTFAAAESLGATRILVTGGVAANRELRVRFTTEAEQRGLHVAFPTLALSTDNAAMIAAAAWPRLLARDFASPDLTADPSLALS